MSKLVYLIPLLPFVGFLLIGLGRKNLSKTLTGIIGCSTVLAAFVISLLIFFEVRHEDFQTQVIQFFPFIEFGKVSIPFAFQVDQLSALFLLIITGVGFLIHMNDLAKEGLILYAAAYSLATIGTFAILTKMKDYTFEGFNGLAKSQPVLAATNTVFLLSLAGIPLTAGFFAKYWMLAAALKTGKFLWLVIFAILCAAVSVYYYFRVIQAMYFRDGVVSSEPLVTNRSFKGWLVFLAAIIILLGIFPQWLLDKLYFL